MKEIKVTYVIYDNDDNMLETFSEKYKALAIARAERIGGKVRKIVETYEELTPIDDDYTVWI